MSVRTQKKVRALGLFSGGLDSILAVKLLQEQGIKVTGITFVSPFFSSRTAEQAGKEMDLPLIIRDITRAHLEIVKDPPHGYGKTMNPCIDCHALMLHVAGRFMEKEGYDFLFTGEVLGERPMSQNRQSLNTVAKASGYQDRILRPLSAKLMKPTLSEETGLVRRDMLLDIQGRSRKPQMEMARRYGLHEYPNPAGGCLLTDKGFSRRLKDLLAQEPDPEIRLIHLLRTGRHFRLNEKVKLVVGRNQRENGVITRIFSNR